MPTDLLSQIEAAAAHRGNIHEKCATCDGKEIIYSNDSTGRSWKCPTCFGTGVVRKVPDLPLSAIAEELRSKDAEIERLGKALDFYRVGHCSCDLCVQARAALAAKESAND